MYLRVTGCWLSDQGQGPAAVGPNDGTKVPKTLWMWYKLSMQRCAVQSLVALLVIAVGYAAEVDEDGDGFFEMVVVYREDPKDVNAFVRERDGSVRPAELKVVEMLRKQDAVLSEFWSRTMKGPENFEEAMRGAREKMKEIAEEAKEGD